MQRESPLNAELSRVPETELLSIEEGNYSAVEFGATPAPTLPDNPTPTVIPPLAELPIPSLQNPIP